MRFFISLLVLSASTAWADGMVCEVKPSELASGFAIMISAPDQSIPKTEGSHFATMAKALKYRDQLVEEGICLKPAVEQPSQCKLDLDRFEPNEENLEMVHTVRVSQNGAVMTVGDAKKYIGKLYTMIFDPSPEDRAQSAVFAYDPRVGALETYTALVKNDECQADASIEPKSCTVEVAWRTVDATLNSEPASVDNDFAYRITLKGSSPQTMLEVGSFEKASEMSKLLLRAKVCSEVYLKVGN